MSRAYDPVWRVLMDVAAERTRQDELRDAGRFVSTLADDGHLCEAEKLACITEEIGEVARCVLANQAVVQEQPSIARLRSELLHVAALSVAWIEALDRQIDSAEASPADPVPCKEKATCPAPIASSSCSS